MDRQYSRFFSQSMQKVSRSAIVPYSAQSMYDLVNDIPAYPHFLPWCGGASVTSVDGSTVHATVHINYHHIKQSFTTENVRQTPHHIEMTLKDGPFKHLDGDWHFIPLSEAACKIEFQLHYEFSNKLLEKVFGPIFNYIANSFVDAFVHRAETIYSEKID